MDRSSDFHRRYSRYAHEARPLAERVRAYLNSRPTETWLFFLAGALVGSILG